MSQPDTLVAELWYGDPPDLTDPALLAGLRALAPATEVQRDSLAVPYAGAEVRPAERTRTDANSSSGNGSGGNGSGGEAPPLLTVVMPGSPLGSDGKALPDTAQTWDWAEADSALASARASVLVTEMFAEGHPASDRVAALASVVAALVAATGPLAISWPTSQKVSDPSEAPAGDLGGLLNVRLFRVSDDEDELVMDTLGLAPFALPDLQCHFRDLAPGPLAAVLHATASYLFEAGDVIADGDTISGPEGDEHWRCRHEDALVGPRRRVLDVDPGEPYAAGRRARG